MKVLITGGAGFIGFHLAERLEDMECRYPNVEKIKSLIGFQPN